MRVLAVSLLVNVALLAALAVRPSLAPPVVRELLVRHFNLGGRPAVELPRDVTPSSRTASAGDSRSSVSARGPLLGAAFATDDFTALSAKMRVAGFPAAVIAEVVRREINLGYEAKIAALNAVDPNTPFWKSSPDAIAAAGRRGALVSQLSQEREKAYRDAVNDPFYFQDSALDIGQRRMWGDLPRAKLDRIQRIEDDYADMMSATRTAAGGIMLTEDQEKLALLEREKQADIAATLSPEEVAEYKLRTGAAGVASRLRLFEPSEAEFRMIAQAQQELNAVALPSRVGGVAPEANQRREAFQNYEAQMKASLGEARYAELLVTTNTEFQNLSHLAEADCLPAATARQAFGVRDQVAHESNRIFDDPNLEPAQKRAALQALVQHTRNQLLSLLGPTSGPAYVKIADSWLNNVANGGAVTFAVTNPLSGATPTFRRIPGPTPPAPGGIINRAP